MKSWKITLVTSLIFMAVVSVIVYSSCVKNACDNVTCLNGGSCGNGVCRCPTGYEDPQCQTLSINRYLGAYAGYTSCNGAQQVIDSAFITAAPDMGINYVAVKFNSVYNDPTVPNKILYGYVDNNESTYAIVVTNNDSSLHGSNFFERIFTITLQNNKTLTIHSYEENIFPTLSGPDTVVNKCMFIGTKD